MVHKQAKVSISPKQEEEERARAPASQERRNGVLHPAISHSESSPAGKGSESWGSLAFERSLLKRLLHALGSPPVAIELWDGNRVGTVCREGHRVQVHDRATLWKLLRRPDFEFAEAYVAGRIETQSDLVELTNSIFTAWRDRTPHPHMEKLRSWGRIGSRSRSAARENVHHHYDLGNDFYRLWLDERLLYTCAYFESKETSLEAAQVAKMDHICRKLCLHPGDRVIEAGCGWGAFALHMARNYGAQVTAYNISREQILYARTQVAQAGLTDRVTFIEEDWRQIRGECDVFVSVGMLEHVGPENYRKLGGIINRCLTPEGRGLIHTIGLNQERALDSWTERRIFPGAQPPTLHQVMHTFEPYELSVLDVENLRLHYALTLRHWLRRFERSSNVVREMFDEQFVRMWRLYLASSVSAFETGWLQLYQILFAPATNNDLPLTRRHVDPLQHGAGSSTK
jgi:cyclopropane-fatty-acyl-phospholipid synthase